MGERIAQAALDCVGARFRLHGRSPASGLDCVGLVAWALAEAGRPVAVPRGYRPRGGDRARWEGLLAKAGLTRVNSEADGDIVLFEAAARQFHLAVRVPGGIVHADVGLRRVTMRPGAPPWPALSAWRSAPGRGEGGE